MSTEHREISAKTVDEAIQIGLSDLGVDLDEVEVDVLDRGRSGILGIGSEPARVRITVRSLEDGASVAHETTQDLLALMGIESEIYIVSPEGEKPIALDLRGDDAGILIGRQGRTLADLQSIVTLLVSRKLDVHTPISLDVEDYKSRRFEQVRRIALRGAQQVGRSGRPLTLEPMGAAERRIVHVTLADNQDVRTSSDGQGSQRQVTIFPA